MGGGGGKRVFVLLRVSDVRPQVWELRAQQQQQEQQQ